MNESTEEEEEEEEIYYCTEGKVWRRRKEGMNEKVEILTL
jgi:hypothetical protein